uniref:Uncharacterized protein n=1 Tax=Oryza glaberrima TaxID=4538 RepID=I1PK05_ORYGL
MPEPVRWLPPKLVLPGCVAIAARTRFSCYLAGARAIDNTAAKKDIAEKINHAGFGFDGLVMVVAALTDGQRSQQLAEMAQPARCTTVFNIQPKGQYHLIKAHFSENEIKNGENGKVDVVAWSILAF